MSRRDAYERKCDVFLEKMEAAVRTEVDVVRESGMDFLSFAGVFPCPALRGGIVRHVALVLRFGDRRQWSSLEMRLWESVELQARILVHSLVSWYEQRQEYLSRLRDQESADGA